MKRFFSIFFATTALAFAQAVIPWEDVSKTGSSLADLATRSASDLNSGTLNVARMPALTGGDATTSAGSGAITFGTVNGNVGAFGSATSVGTFTVDGKGRVTSAGNTTVTPAWASITGKPTTVSGFAITDAYTISQSDARRNLLAPRSGIAFDATAGARISSTLTGQAIATDVFSVVTVVRPNTTAPSLGNDEYVAISDGTVTNSFTVRTESGGQLRVLLFGATGSDYVRWSLANFITNYGGKGTLIAVIRNASGNPAVYLNGTDVTASGTFDAGGSSSWQGTVASTFLRTNAGGQFSIFSLSLYNVALAAADVLEIYERGGGVPFRYQFGSQAGLITGDNSTFASDAGFWTLSGATISGGSLNLPNGSYALRGSALALGKRYRAVAVASAVTGTPIFGAVSNTTYSAFGVGTSTYDFTSDGTSFGFSATGPSNAATVDSVTLVRLGAVVHLPLDEGIGYQLHDASTNELDAVMTTTGVAHLIPKRSGYVRGTLTWSGTHEPKSLLGQRAFPDGTVTELFTYQGTASSSGSGLTIGTTNTAARWVALDTYTANAKEVATLANRLPAGSAANDHDGPIVDPDTANFTGSLKVEAHYRVTVGTP